MPAWCNTYGTLLATDYYTAGSSQLFEDLSALAKSYLSMERYVVSYKWGHDYGLIPTPTELEYAIKKCQTCRSLTLRIMSTHSMLLRTWQDQCGATSAAPATTDEVVSCSECPALETGLPGR
jgi:hypothetical protein